MVSVVFKTCCVCDGHSEVLTNSLDSEGSASNDIVVLVVDVDGGRVSGVSGGPSELVLRLLDPWSMSVNRSASTG